MEWGGEVGKGVVGGKNRICKSIECKRLLLLEPNHTNMDVGIITLCVRVQYVHVCTAPINALHSQHNGSVWTNPHHKSLAPNATYMYMDTLCMYIQTCLQSLAYFELLGVVILLTPVRCPPHVHHTPYIMFHADCRALSAAENH